MPAHRLGATAIAAALVRANLSPDQVQDVIIGQVLTAGQGQNPARQAAIAGGIGENATAWGVNQVCGSGRQAVARGMQQILCGDASVVVAGGQESMSMPPHCQTLRSPARIGPVTLVDTVVVDGLTAAFGGYHMGTTAENVARHYGITREQQDAFALRSQQKAEAFAAQACAVGNAMGWTPDKVNVNGGAIALGHPYRSFRRQGRGDTDPRNAPKRQPKGACHALYRRRYGHRDVH